MCCYARQPIVGQLKRTRGAADVDNEATDYSPAAKRVYSEQTTHDRYDVTSMDDTESDDEWDEEATSWIDISGVDATDIERLLTVDQFDDVTPDEPSDTWRVEGELIVDCLSCNDCVYTLSKSL